MSANDRSRELGRCLNDDLQLYRGDMHLNLHPHRVPMIERTYAAARSHLDFFPIAYYPFNSYTSPEGLSLEAEGQVDVFLKPGRRSYLRLDDTVIQADS